jgi:tetratricopeptide (TPR) repeat protein
VAQKIKAAQMRSKALALACQGLIRLGDLANAKVFFEESLSINGISWETYHAESAIALAEAVSKIGKSDDLFSIVRKIKSTDSQAEAFASLAEGFAKAQKTDQANKAFEEALITVGNIDELGHRIEVLHVVVESSMKANMLDETKRVLDAILETIRKANDQDGLQDGFLKAAQRFAELGEIDKTTNILRQAFAFDWSGYNTNRNYSIAIATEKIAKAGRVAEVFSIMQVINVGVMKPFVLKGIASGLLIAGISDEAIKVMNGINDVGERLDVFTDAAEELIRRNKINEAKSVLEKVLPMLRTDRARIRKNDSFYSRVTSLVTLLLKVDALDQALEIALLYPRFTQLWGAVTVRSRQFSDNPLLAAILGLAKAGEADRARLWLTLSFFPNEFEELTALSAVVVALITSGKIDAANELQSKLLKTAASINDQVLRVDDPDDPVDRALTDVAIELTRAGQLDAALNVAKAMQFDSNRNRYLIRKSVELAKLGKQKEAVEAADQISDRASRSKALADLIVWLADADNGEQAQSLIAKVEFSDDKSRAEGAIAKWQARKGFIRAACQTASSGTSPVDRITTFTAILIEYIAKENPEMGRDLKAKVSNTQDNATR